jgi:hypothetical protein
MNRQLSFLTVALGAGMILTSAGTAQTTATPVMMPDGKAFEFWDDTTRYTTTYVVARENPVASDENPGTAEKPFATIGKAAALLKPGEKVIVHAGTYRECVRPARGGEGPDRMIAYEAAPGETVRILGSEILSGSIRPSEGWQKPADGQPSVWMADLPPAWFAASGYNPFALNNMSAEFRTFTHDWSAKETRRQQLRRGMVFADGIRLAQVFRTADVFASNGTFWVEEPGMRIHFRLPGDADPAKATIEATAREQVFTPAVRGLGYIRVKGFTMEHAADGVPIPQRALLSAYRGHHWIIEDNTVRWANACGIDIGRESWHAWVDPKAAAEGTHIVRRNHVSDCGICGIAGVGNVNGSLVEGNLVENVGWHNIERMWETAGIKFHTCTGVLIRNNVFRYIQYAPGLWLDYRNTSTRVTGNLFMDIQALNGAIYLEASHGPNVIDHNIFSDIRPDKTHREFAHAINVDIGEKCTVAHNLFMDIPEGFAVAMHLGQAGRDVEGRNMLGRKHKVLNNIFVRCPKRVLFERTEDNVCDGNLYDRSNDAMSFRVEYPSPKSIVNFEAWQEFFGYDLKGRQASIQATLDPKSLAVSLDIKGPLPECAPVPELGDAGSGTQPGPFELDVEQGPDGTSRARSRSGN